MNLRSAWLISWTVLLEALRRKEIYAIVLVSSLLIGAVMTVDFFEIRGLTKFYREVALHVMSIATALAVIVLAARQLPREFESRTIYPLLAKPVSRWTFLFGKLMGVMLAGLFCFVLFMFIYLAGTFYLGGDVPWGLFFQYIYLQMVMMLILASLAFWLSMFLNLDAAITIGVILYASASLFSSMISYIYDFADPWAQKIIVALVYIIPQLPLLDLSQKTVHAQMWDPLSLGTMAALTVYGCFYAALYLAFAMISFRRRPL